MDPFTLGLIATGLFAAYRIKRASAPPPRPQAEEAPEPEPVFPGGFPPHAFGGGRGLRPAVTEGRRITHERNIEGEAEGERGRERAGEEPANVAPLGVFNPRAQEAIASSAAADVVGATTRAPQTQLPGTYSLGGKDVYYLGSTPGAVAGTSHPSTYPK